MIYNSDSDEEEEIKRQESFSSHSSADSKVSHDLELFDSTQQYDKRKMIDEKNFLFSGIKLEFKDEFKLLNDLRTLPNDANPMQNMVEFYGKVMLGCAIGIVLMPTLVLLMIDPTYNLFVWVVAEVAICIMAIDHFTRRYAIIN